ncbi:MAG: TonB-dependent receptor [Bacteroidales bacterium]|nr:TonB-dependent receptor [Bacteroidales bacterium]MBN2762361.1 TonB-dependent receptor [Bacteroidales bacterium]
MLEFVGLLRGHYSGIGILKGLALPVFISLLMTGMTETAICQPATRQITGTVIAADDNSPIPGANIVIKGRQTGTVTDLNGRFLINAADDDILVISFIGYTPREIKVGNQNVLNIRLEQEVTKLDEVVVVGYGTMRRSDLTSAVVSISADEIKQTIGSSFDQALQGRAAGVFVTQNTGAPGGGVSVRIRGVNTLSGSNEPLYVIDGVQIEGFTGDITYNNSIGNVLSTINPADIVDMQILKDASATAIYGSRAANGVIIITTRKGKAGESKISYEGSYGIQQLPYYIPTMNLREFAEYRNSKQDVLGHGSRTEWQDPSILGEGTNWQKELFRNAPMQNHVISVFGGNDNTTFAVSGGYFDQDGIATGSNFKRYNVKLNVDNQTRDWLRIGANVLANQSRQVITVEDQNIINTALEQTPDVLVKNPDGSWAGPDSNIYGEYVTNPIAMALMKENERKNSQVMANAYLDVTFLKDFVFRNEISTNLSYSNSYNFTPTYEFGDYVKNVISTSSRGANNSFYWSFYTSLRYSHKFFEKHNFSLLLLHEASESRWEGISASRDGFLINSIHELDAGDLLTAKNGGYKGSNAQESYLGRLNYTFADKYLLQATIRTDGSSKFGQEKRWGVFPSFSLAWKIGDEAFLNNIEQINDMKLRFSWGLVGNSSIPDYAYGSALGNRATVWGTGVLPQRISNPDVQWESTRETNIGLDLYMFNNRIEFIAEVYKKYTDNLLLPLPLPAYAGVVGGDYTGAIEPPYVNIGALENKGFEFTLNTVNIERGGLQWRTGLVFTLYRNKVLELTTDNAVVDGSIGANIITRTQVDKPVGLFYGYVVEGMFNTEDDFYRKDAAGNFVLDNEGNKVLVALPEDASFIGVSRVWVGDYKFRDMNGDSVINESDRTFIGDPNPDFTFGFNSRLTYKNFDLSVNITGTYGNKIYNWTRMRFEDPNTNRGVFRSVKDYARIGVIDPEMTAIDPETGETIPADQIISNVYITNEGTEIPRLTNYSANANNRISDRFVEDGSYLRIRNLVLGYAIPAKIVSKVKMESVRVYFNIQNLYTFSKYHGYDPEVGSIHQNMLLTGIDNGRYPSQRIYTFGINVNF